MLAAKSSRKLSDSIHALGERRPCLSTVYEQTLPPTPASLKVKKIAGIPVTTLAKYKIDTKIYII